MEAPPTHIWELQICKTEYSRQHYKWGYFIDIQHLGEYVEWLQQRKDRVYRVLSRVVPVDSPRFCEATGNDILMRLADFKKAIIHS
jgi:hypothetical protein